jgi:hypothetical protein
MASRDSQDAIAFARNISLRRRRISKGPGSFPKVKEDAPLKERPLYDSALLLLGCDDHFGLGNFCEEVFAEAEVLIKKT